MGISIIYLGMDIADDDKEKIFRFVQNISFTVGVILSAVVLKKTLSVAGIDLESGFDFFKLLSTPKK